MHPKHLFYAIALLLVNVQSKAQVTGQPNIDFELGNTSVWNYYVGRCCPLVLDTPTGALPDRHTLTSGAAVDPYGNFPIVSPEGGNYSLKLGNTNVYAKAERAEYFVHVPAGTTDYGLIFRYAVVFQDPGHDEDDQPRFAVNAYDSATGAPVECAQYLYIASSELPGFKDATGAMLVKYKEWTTASINLSGYAGHTVKLHFTSGDCALGAHFGYGYVDVSAGLFAISSAYCARSATLTGPFGFDKYLWYDSSFTTLIDTSQTTTIHNPLGAKTYALIIKPYPGYGCPDTLYTKIYPAPDPGYVIAKDTCNKDILLSGPDSIASYLWYDPLFSTLVGTSKTISVHHPTVPGTYVLVIETDSGTGCMDTIYKTIDPVPPSPGYTITTKNCNHETALLSAPPGFNVYQWYDPANNVLYGTRRTETFPNPPGPKTYAVIVEPAVGAGCPDTILATIKPSYLEPVPMDDLLTCKGTYIGVTADAEGGVGQLKYEWDIPGADGCRTCKTFTKKVRDSATISVVITDSEGCSVVNTVHISLDTCLLVLPNAFTPNGDGKNDIFRVRGTGFEYFTHFSFGVFNRFGQRVFYTEDINAGWDGVFNGNKQDLGTFFYLVQYNLADEQQTLKGDVTLVR